MLAPGARARGCRRAVSIRCRLRSPQQHGERDHHEDDHRAPQREPAPGVEEVVQRLGDPAVGEDRPDQLLQHAGEPGGDEPAGQRSPDAVAGAGGTARRATQALRPSARRQATPSHDGCWSKVSMTSSGRLSATNTLRRSTRLISTAQERRQDRRQGACDRAGQDRRIAMAEQAAAGDQQACGEQREAERGIAEGQGADDDRAVLEHHQDADHRHEHVRRRRVQPGPDRVAPGGGLRLLGAARGDDLEGHGLMPASWPEPPRTGPADGRSAP